MEDALAYPRVQFPSRSECSTRESVLVAEVAKSLGFACFTSLSTSPTATKDAAAPTPGDKPATDKADAKEGGDAYPRPNGTTGEDGAVKKDEAHKEEAKKDEQQQNKKDKAKQQFEDAKPQHHNKNPQSVKNVPIKQPGGQQH